MLINHKSSLQLFAVEKDAMACGFFLAPLPVYILYTTRGVGTLRRKNNLSRYYCAHYGR